MVPVVAPGIGHEARLPAGERDVSRVAVADDHPCAGPEQGDQAEEVDVVGQLVDDSRGGEGGYRIQPLQVTPGRRLGSTRGRDFQGLERVDGRLADERGQRLEDAQDLVQLARPVDLG